MLLSCRPQRSLVRVAPSTARRYRRLVTNQVMP